MRKRARVLYVDDSRGDEGVLIDRTFNVSSVVFVCVFVYKAIVSNAQFIRVRAICALALVIISSSSYGIHLGAAVFQLYHIHTSIHLSKQSSIHLLHGYTRMSTSTYLCIAIYIFFAAECDWGQIFKALQNKREYLILVE